MIVPGTEWLPACQQTLKVWVVTQLQLCVFNGCCSDTYKIQWLLKWRLQNAHQGCVQWFWSKWQSEVCTQEKPTAPASQHLPQTLVVNRFTLESGKAFLAVLPLKKLQVSKISHTLISTKLLKQKSLPKFHACNVQMLLLVSWLPNSDLIQELT